MSDSTPQSFKSHARFDPPYHFVTAAVLAVNLFIVLCFTWKYHNLFTFWMCILSIAIWIPLIKLRSYPLKVQDRVIRLEERLRLQALEHNLDRKQIKERIKVWRPDYYRV